MSDSNFFDILKNPVGELGNLEREYLGPDYKYYKKIKTPSQLGMGSKGSFKQLGKDISGLVDYVEVLVTGRSNAQTKPTPLGDRFFLKTGAQCKDPDGKLQDRWMYVDNIPDGDIPIISSALDYNFTDFEGLVPGAISKMNDLNPTHFMKAFVSGSEPPCRNITLNTVDVNDNSSFDTHHVSDYDIAYINPCNFRGKKNPVTNKGCQEGFLTMNESLEKLNKIFNINTSATFQNSNKNKMIQFKNILEKSYYTAASLLLLYIMFKLLTRKG
jgi:hypothetical protein